MANISEGFHMSFTSRQEEMAWWAEEEHNSIMLGGDR
jgi:hypothetical protein